ncbi:hypothetical protein [Aquimarina agarivorans]|uniref:hypothetical protein n=1 Tax=Aquimarina agarivorans TaxID=980584 RepID=UPI0002E50C5D|nr:hypothetical protein [Aquimarina agarivorans]
MKQFPINKLISHINNEYFNEIPDTIRLIGGVITSVTSFALDNFPVSGFVPITNILIENYSKEQIR